MRVELDRNWTRIVALLAAFGAGKFAKMVEETVIRWLTMPGGPVDLNFRKRGRPRWRKLSKAYQKRKGAAGKGRKADLSWSGSLRREAMKPRNYRAVKRGNRTRFQAALPLPYWRAHEFGHPAGGLPRRSFIQRITTGDLVKLKDMLIEKFEKLSGGESAA